MKVAYPGNFEDVTNKHGQQVFSKAVWVAIGRHLINDRELYKDGDAYANAVYQHCERGAYLSKKFDAHRFLTEAVYAVDGEDNKISLADTVDVIHEGLQALVQAKPAANVPA